MYHLCHLVFQDIFFEFVDINTKQGADCWTDSLSNVPECSRKSLLHTLHRLFQRFQLKKDDKGMSWIYLPIRAGPFY
jgi:hypothetical protein